MNRRFRSPNAGQTSLSLQHDTSPRSGYRPALGHNRDGYPTGGIPVQGFKVGGRVALKRGKTPDKKWIQKAVNPKHKGFCTPMTKKTCTPHRKALARTFKKWGKAKKGAA